jgi:hypothetical protein
VGKINDPELNSRNYLRNIDFIINIMFISPITGRLIP